MYKTFKIKFIYRDSIKPIVAKYRKLVPRNDFQMYFADEFVNVFDQQMCDAFNLKMDDFTTPNDISKNYRIGWCNETGALEVTFCFPNEEEFNTIVDKNYKGCTYTYMSMIYNNYYRIALNNKYTTLISFLKDTIRADFGTFEDFKPSNKKE